MKELLSQLKSLSDYQLLTLDNHPFTAGKLVIALALLLLSTLLSRRLSRVLGRLILPKLGMDHRSAGAFQTLAFYGLLIVFVLFVLNFINFPLTFFTVLAGVVAVGLGFAGQALLKNFISGLILLFEQPIRVGDLIEIESFKGIVEKIGLRSTRIRTGNNLQLIVPNSSLIEKNIVNWTLSDDRVVISVRVGVAYGSPVDKVNEVLLQIMKAHPNILQTPEPTVYLADFGENSLLFELSFSIKIKNQIERGNIQSEVRLAIEKAFRASDIQLPFPQREIRGNSQQPIWVNIKYESRP